MKIILFLFFMVISLFAEVARVTAVVGDATIKRANKIIVVKLGTIVDEKDIIKTKNNSKLQVIFKDKTIITLGKNSALDINEYLFDEKNPKKSKSDLNFFKGAFKAISGKIGKINKEKFKLRTKSSTIGIRGTVVLADQQNIVCLSGAITVELDNQKVFVEQNQITQIKEGKLTPAKDVNPDILNNLSNSLEPEDKESSPEALKKEKDSEEKKKTKDKPKQIEEKEKKKIEKKVKKVLSSTTVSTGENIEGATLAPPPPNDGIMQEDSSLSIDGGFNTSSPPPPPPTSLLQQDLQRLNDGKVVTVNNSEFNISGNILGLFSTSSISNLQQEDTNLQGNRTNNTYSINDSINRTVLGTSNNNAFNLELTKTFNSFDEIKIGGYTGLLNSNISLPYSYTLGNGHSFTGSYTLKTDNMGEFFVAYTNENNFKELIAIGRNSNTTNLQKSKVYIYKDFKNLQIQTTSAGNFDEVKLSDGGGFIYYNANLNSLTHLNKDFSKNGAQEFVIGDFGKAIAYNNKYEYVNASGEVSLSKITSNTEANLSIKGTDFQGVIYNLKNEVKKDEVTTQIENTLGTAFLEKKVNASTSGIIEYDGFLVGTAVRPWLSTVINSTSDNLTFKVDRSNGNIYSDILNVRVLSNNFSTNNGKFKLSGVNGQSSYYINDDLFGVKLDSSETIYKNGSDTFTMDSNSGYLIAVPDGALNSTGDYELYDSSDNPLMSNDDASWGYWTAKFSTSDNTKQPIIDPYSTWVAGVETSDGKVNEFLNNDSAASVSFAGSVIGSVTKADGTIESIVNNDPSSNFVNLNFNIGNSTKNMNGEMKFSTQSTSWQMNLSSDAITSNNISGSLGGSTSILNSQGETTNTFDNTGSFNAKFYGNGSVKSVGGQFNSTAGENSSVYKANGVFKAIKK